MFSDLSACFLADRSYLIAVHRDPDFDAVGSALALWHQMQAHGFQACVWIPGLKISSFLCLPGVREIEISDRVPDGFDTMIVLDCSKADRICGYEAVRPFWDQKQVINIDHHSDNPGYGQVNVVLPISSVCELLCAFFEFMKWPLSLPVGTCLYAGIIFDTGNFQHANVTSATFACAARIADLGVPLVDISRAVFGNKSLHYFHVLRHALDRLQVDDSAPLAYTILDRDSEVTGSDIVNMILQIEGVEVCFVVQPYDERYVKVNLRSSTAFDVAAFAARFGGGGHQKAAGITVEGGVVDVLGRVLYELRVALGGGN